MRPPRSDTLALRVLLLVLQFPLPSAQWQCDLTAMVGDMVTIPLGFSAAAEYRELTWRHGLSTVFSRTDKTVRTGKGDDVTTDGSLVLLRVTMDHSGRYSARVMSRAGWIIHEMVQTLCVTANRQCPLTALVGDTVTIPLGFSHAAQYSELMWQRGPSILFNRKDGTVRISKEDITRDGSLVLRRATMHHSGRYIARVISTTGRIMHERTRILCVTGTVYGLLGGEAELDPGASEKIKNIKWNARRSKISEWERDKAVYYKRCKTGDKCELNPTTGVLIMKGLKPEDEGQYSAEINWGTSVRKLELTLLRPVSTPNVTAFCSETQCTLTCVGQETKHTKYSWKVNGESVNEGNEKLLVEKTGDQSKSYSCVFSNPKSEKDSDPVTEMDLFPEPVSKPNVTVSCNETQCTLTCVGQETKHTKYSWKENNKTVKEGNTLTVEKTGDQSKSYTCVFSNPKSEEHSDPLTEMDLFPEPVSKPNVTASCSETQCTLTCVGEETKDTKYSWKENDETVKEGNTLTLEKTGDQSKSYTCVFSNPKSEKDSDPVTEMDLFPEPVSKPNVTKSCSETQCTLTCVGEETKRTKYSWKENDKTVKEGNTLTLEKTGDQSKSYTCVFSNPKSEKDSDPVTEMDLFAENKGYDIDREPVLEQRSWTTMDGWTHGYNIAILTAIMALALLVMMIYYCRRSDFKRDDHRRTYVDSLYGAECRDTVYKPDEPPASAAVDSVSRDPSPREQMRRADGENATLV